MKVRKRKFSSSGLALPKHQKGALTMISAILILILLTELIIYAVQVGVFEQRKSSNELRQKEAFHIAESALEIAKQYLGESEAVSSADWLANRWKPCAGGEESPDIDKNEGTHPCYAEPAYDSPDEDDDDMFAEPYSLRKHMYFWDFGETADHFGNPTIPIDVDALVTDTTQRVNVYALLCMLDLERDPNARKPGLENSVVQGCTTEVDRQDPVYYMVTLLARGEADCTDKDNGPCSAQALISQKMGSFGPAVGENGPGVPMITRNTLPPGGTVEIVPNSNGGGEGVPVSAWINQNMSCPNIPNYIAPSIPLEGDGASWSTCEKHEWYGTDIMPDDYLCPTATCGCDDNTFEKARRLSYEGNENFDLVADEEFPCDLWDYMLGVPKYDEDGQINEDSIGFIRDFRVGEENIIDGSECGNLGPESSGWIWVEGGKCDINGNLVIGSPDDDPDTPEGPVFLIVTTDLKLAGGAQLFGTIFLTDAMRLKTDPAASVDFDASGGGTVYGALVIDSEIGNFNGEFDLVYLEQVIKNSLIDPQEGAVSGGWSDFHPDWR